MIYGDISFFTILQNGTTYYRAEQPLYYWFWFNVQIVYFRNIYYCFYQPCNQWTLHQPHKATHSNRHQPRNDKDTNPMYVGTSNQESPTKRATHGANINQCKWEQFAQCLDRLFFICYLIIFAIFFFLNIVTLFAGCRQREDENKDWIFRIIFWLFLI